MQYILRFRIPALFCALAVLVCELVSRPFVTMGVCDDWPYSLMAKTLAETGRFAYNGWAAPMLGWQLYLGAAFVRLFGYSLTTVRMSTLCVSIALAFLLQRTLVRADVSERNATIATLGLVLTPIYMMLSVTFMTDITGLFGIVICLYGCLRAVRGSTTRATIAWLCFAVATNAIFGSSRQISWLGILVMVPSTLWVLRRRRDVLIAGVVATLAGVVFIFVCLHWLKQQPYLIPEHVLAGEHPAGKIFWQLIDSLMDLPFLLLPIVALFLPQLRKYRPLTLVILAVAFTCYLWVAVQPQHRHGPFMLEPTVDDWISVYGIYRFVALHGDPPLFLNRGVQVVLTIVTFASLIGLMTSLIWSRRSNEVEGPPVGISWPQLGMIVAPFAIVYTLLLLPRAGTEVLFDRYLLPLLVVGLLCVVRYYQERMQSRLPFVSVVLVVVMGVYGVVVTHNMFALYRGRVALAAELRANGIPDTAVDNGWEYNLGVELQHANHLNESKIKYPADAYVPTPAPAAGLCSTLFGYDATPHVHALYGVSFDRDACNGAAPFAPVTYSRWPGLWPGVLYVVYFSPPH